jgi:hypothetical protein
MCKKMRGQDAGYNDTTIEKLCYKLLMILLSWVRLNVFFVLNGFLAKEIFKQDY